MMKLQEDFEDLVAAVDECCALRFGTRLRGAYLGGSVAAGEAWPGASDLDWFVFLQEEPTRADRKWKTLTRRQLEGRYPIASEVHLNVYPVDRLAREEYWRFILRYNAVQVRGDNLLAELARCGIRAPRPSRSLAKSRLSFMRQCLEETVAGRCPPSLAELPADPFLTTRKLARNFVIVEGAHVLMAKGVFKSFKQEAVLEGLRSITRRWRPLLKMTEATLRDPYQAAVPPDEFMKQVGPFVTWAMVLIEDA